MAEPGDEIKEYIRKKLEEALEKRLWEGYPEILDIKPNVEMENITTEADLANNEYRFSVKWKPDQYGLLMWPMDNQGDGT